MSKPNSPRRLAAVILVAGSALMTSYYTLLLYLSDLKVQEALILKAKQLEDTIARLNAKQASLGQVVDAVVASGSLDYCADGQRISSDIARERSSGQYILSEMHQTNRYNPDYLLVQGSLLSSAAQEADALTDVMSGLCVRFEEASRPVPTLPSVPDREPDQGIDALLNRRELDRPYSLD